MVLIFIIWDDCRAGGPGLLHKCSLPHGKLKKAGQVMHNFLKPVALECNNCQQMGSVSGYWPSAYSEPHKLNDYDTPWWHCLCLWDYHQVSHIYCLNSFLLIQSVSQLCSMIHFLDWSQFSTSIFSYPKISRGRRRWGNEPPRMGLKMHVSKAPESKLLMHPWDPLIGWPGKSTEYMKAIYANDY